jgi:hypothetical protein
MAIKGRNDQNWFIDFQIESATVFKTSFLAIATAAALVLSPVARAQPLLSPDRFAVGVTAGSDGVGGDLQYQANRFLVLRVRGTWLDFNYVGNAASLHYKARFGLSQGGGYAELHPFANPWANPLMLSLGGVTGGRGADISALRRNPITLHGVVVPPQAIGTVAGDATLTDPAPFVGLGFDNTFTTRSRFGFKLVAGVVLSRPPVVSLAPINGLAAQHPTLAAPSITQAANAIRQDGQIFQHYPEISAGLTYRF